jgi:hypothetical protein
MQPILKIPFLTVVCVATSIASTIRLEAGTITVGLDPTANWVGYMNVFNIPQNGSAYQFGSSWGTADLCSSWPGPILTLSPNTIGDPNSYWYTPSGGPGAIGNKIMDANLYVEQNGSFSGQTVTFSGNVLANTLFGHTDALGNGWTSVAFIKDFAPDYSSSVSATAPLSAGLFSISLNTVNDPARHVQYGFETIGPDVWSTDVAPFGSIQITAVPEPATLSLVGLGMLGLISGAAKAVTARSRRCEEITSTLVSRQSRLIRYSRLFTSSASLR